MRRSGGPEQNGAVCTGKAWNVIESNSQRRWHR